jgi:ferredoxin
MAYVVDDKCINCKHTTCVSVCPVECFYEGPNMLVINPEECIDCGLCEPECPELAIYETDDKNDDWYQLNLKYSLEWPNITEEKEPLSNYDEWSGYDGSKLEYLQK